LYICLYFIYLLLCNNSVSIYRLLPCETHYYITTITKLKWLFLNWYYVKQLYTNDFKEFQNSMIMVINYKLFHLFSKIIITLIKFFWYSSCKKIFISFNWWLIYLIRWVLFIVRIIGIVMCIEVMYNWDTTVYHLIQCCNWW
jgi:hypothetical protein